MATGKITKRTLDALQAGAVTGFLWDDELKGDVPPFSWTGV